MNGKVTEQIKEKICLISREHLLVVFDQNGIRPAPDRTIETDGVILSRRQINWYKAHGWPKEFFSSNHANILTADEVAARLGVGRSTVRGWCADGLLKAFKPSHSVMWLITEEALAQFTPPKMGRPKERWIICDKCGERSTDHNLDDWLTALVPNSQNEMIIRCPECITEYAIRKAGGHIEEGRGVIGFESWELSD